MQLLLRDQCTEPVRKTAVKGTAVQEAACENHSMFCKAKGKEKTHLQGKRSQ